MEIEKWLIQGDPSIAFLSCRDLYFRDGVKYKEKIGKIGWCAEYLKVRNPDGYWGLGFYRPKWICTHYTLFELKNLQYNKNDISIRNEIEKIHLEDMGDDLCIAGMYLNYASYFGAKKELVKLIIDFILDNKMDDGGYNCEIKRSGAVHSSLHTTISVLEGLNSFLIEGYSYKKNEVKESIKNCIQFILEHKLYKSSTTNQVIDQKFLRMTYPFRWKYTIVRALNCLVDLKVPYDERMKDSIEYILSKRTKEGIWKMQSIFPGNIYFEMEKTGMPSRLLTYFCLKIINKYTLT